MNSFISKVVQDILSKHKQYHNITIVLPSRRACVFVKEAFIKKVPQVTFLPDILSIEDYIQEVAQIELIDNTRLLFEFYNSYKSIIPKENLTEFDAFSQWATIALHDFNEVDSYLVNTADFFDNLRDVKRLNEWFKGKKPSALAENYLQFFEYLKAMYQALYEKLLQNKVGYQGMIYREAINKLETYKKNNAQKHFIFVGFNALNKAEETLIQNLLNSNRASVYWDVSEEILSPDNEAGLFLRRYKNSWKYYKENPFSVLEPSLVKDKNYQIIGAPKNTTQIKYVGNLLSRLDNFSNTALVLADENLLTIALNSLPNEVENINITMGYPLMDIPMAGFFNKLFKLHLNQQKFNKQLVHQFYYKDVLALLNDPFLNKFYPLLLQKLIQEIKKENRLFLTVADLKDYLLPQEKEELNEVFSLFHFSENINAVIKQCASFTEHFKDKVSGVEREYLFRFYKVFRQLESLNETYNHLSNLKSLYAFYQQILKNEKLSFQGEPLKGLQLMGMLETRVLDFETVIITSVNEGILPGSKSELSFIPYDVKKYYGLPVYQEKDAIFSYHFQRLLQRANNIFLIYNTEKDGYGGGEKSRFLTRLEIQNPTIKKINSAPAVRTASEKPIEIEKTAEVMEKLKAFCTKGISPSALVNYIYNPIQFYEQKILDIKEENQVEETIEANTMGTIIHEVLLALYKPYINSFLRIDDIDSMETKVPDLLQLNFEREYKSGNIEIGKNKLIYEVSRKQILRFLSLEKQLLRKGKKLKIIALEKEYKTAIHIDGINYILNLKGTIDRVDELDGVTRIVDYKTGKVDKSNLKLPDLSMMCTDYKYSKIVQVLFYAYLYNQENPEFSNPMEAGIISFKNLNAGFLKMNFGEGREEDCAITSERMNEFLTELKLFIKLILDKEMPFIQNENLPF